MAKGLFLQVSVGLPLPLPSSSPPPHSCELKFLLVIPNLLCHLFSHLLYTPQDCPSLLLPPPLYSSLVQLQEFPTSTLFPTTGPSLPLLGSFPARISHLQGSNLPQLTAFLSPPPENSFCTQALPPPSLPYFHHPGSRPLSIPWAWLCASPGRPVPLDATTLPPPCVGSSALGPRPGGPFPQHIFLLHPEPHLTSSSSPGTDFQNHDPGPSQLPMACPAPPLVQVWALTVSSHPAPSCGAQNLTHQRLPHTGPLFSCLHANLGGGHPEPCSCPVPSPQALTSLSTRLTLLTVGTCTWSLPTSPGLHHPSLWFWMATGSHYLSKSFVL